MDAQVRMLQENETTSVAACQAGEEVCAILEGQFSIDVAGTPYCLAAGEALLIPNGIARRFLCQSARGVVYRVTAPTSASLPCA